MMRSQTFHCAACGLPMTMTVHADRSVRAERYRPDGRVMDRFRLLAASQGWVIDFDGNPWCERHHPPLDGCGGPVGVAREEGNL